MPALTPEQEVEVLAAAATSVIVHCTKILTDAAKLDHAIRRNVTFGVHAAVRALDAQLTETMAKAILPHPGGAESLVELQRALGVMAGKLRGGLQGS